MATAQVQEQPSFLKPIGCSQGLGRSSHHYWASKRNGNSDSAVHAVHGASNTINDRA